MSIVDQSDSHVDQKAVKRFTSYDEFLKEFYPKSVEHQARKNVEGDDGDFGVELAIESLSRHASILKFGSP